MVDPEICTLRSPPTLHSNTRRARSQRLGCLLPNPLHRSTGGALEDISGLILIRILFLVTSALQLPLTYALHVYLIFSCYFCKYAKWQEFCLSVYYCLLPVMLKNVLSQPHTAHSYYFISASSCSCLYLYQVETSWGSECTVWISSSSPCP